jgi:hypothetical protein
MKTSLTQKQILEISRKTGMSFDFRMSKKGMMEWVVAGLSGVVRKAEPFAAAVLEADKQYQRERKLKQLGL